MLWPILLPTPPILHGPPLPPHDCRQLGPDTVETLSPSPGVRGANGAPPPLAVERSRRRHGGAHGRVASAPTARTQKAVF